MQSLSNKVVVITGASRGIGKGIAELFAGENTRIVLVARKKTDLQAVADSLGLPKEQVAIVATDISTASGMRKVVTAAYRRFGSLDIFINNAGVGFTGPVVDMNEKDFDRLLATNLKSVFFCFREVIPRMREQGGGHIINISSMAGKQAVPNMAVYAASKAALNVMSESVGGEVRNDNIRVCTVAPASTDTGFGSRDGSKRPAGNVATKLTVSEVAATVLHVAKQNTNAWVSYVDIRPLAKKG